MMVLVRLFPTIPHCSSSVRRGNDVSYVQVQRAKMAWVYINITIEVNFAINRGHCFS